MRFLSQLTSRYLLLILILIWSLLITACQNQPSPPAAEPTPAATSVSQTEADQLVMAEYMGEKSFEMLYPASWIYQLPRVGFLIFAGEETLNQAQPGPQMSVLRVPIAQVHGNAEGELNHYLDFGPLRAGYTKNGEYEPLTIGGQEAWAVSLSYEGDGDEMIPMETYIVSSETESGAVYIFTSTSPAEMWDQYETTFQVMINSVAFTE